MTDSRRVALCLLCLVHLLLIAQVFDLRGYLRRDVVSVDREGCFAKVYLLFHSYCQEELILVKAFRRLIHFLNIFFFIDQFEDIFLALTLLIEFFFVVDDFRKRVKVRQIVQLMYDALHVYIHSLEGVFINFSKLRACHVNANLTAVLYFFGHVDVDKKFRGSFIDKKHFFAIFF